MTWQHPSSRTALTGSPPESVALVGLGPSAVDFQTAHIAHDFRPPWEEVWTINAGLRFVPHDVAFVMDDLQKELTRYQSDAYPDSLRGHGRPIISSAAHPEVPASFTYPLREVAEWWGRWPSMPRSSVPAILAYAGFIGVRSLYLFGIDYFGDGGRREEGGMWCAFWLGRLLERGCAVNITQSSKLLDTAARMSDPDYVSFYGYAVPPALHRK